MNAISIITSVIWAVVFIGGTLWYIKAIKRSHEPDVCDKCLVVFTSLNGECPNCGHHNHG